MLTLVEDSRIDLMRVTAICNGPGRGECSVWMEGQSEPMIFGMMPTDMTALVNAAQAKATDRPDDSPAVPVGPTADATHWANYNQGTQDALAAVRRQIQLATEHGGLNHVWQWVELRLERSPTADQAAPSDATLVRIETLRNLLDEMDSCDNPDAAECWTHIRRHIKGKLGYWMVQANQMAPAQVSPNAQAFLTPKGVDAISVSARLVALHEVDSMMVTYVGVEHEKRWTEFWAWLQEEIKATERKQAEAETSAPEVK